MAQNPNFTPNMVKIHEGLTLEYRDEFISEDRLSNSEDDESPEFTVPLSNFVSNETYSILQVNNKTGIILFEVSSEPPVYRFNSSMGEFGNIAIYAHWGYWKDNVGIAHPFLYQGVDFDAPYEVDLINTEKKFGFKVTQDIDIDSDDRSHVFLETKLVYSKTYGVLLEKTRSRITNLHNNPDHYSLYSLILMTEIDFSEELQIDNKIYIILLIGILVVVTFGWRYYKSYDKRSTMNFNTKN